MTDHGEMTWRVRPVMTGAIGALAGWSIWRLIGATGPFDPTSGMDARAAGATGIAVAATLVVFTLERRRASWSAAFALTCGVIAGLVVWWNGEPGHGGLWDWRTAAVFLAVAIAAPLFQTARDAGGMRFDYREIHGHAWTNVMLWFAGWGFCAIVWLLAWLLVSLFQLIGIEAPHRWLTTDWFAAMLIGGAAGGGVGLLRERETVVRTLQRVVLAILGVLAPVLAIGLVLFLLSLPFTGLGALWQATKSTTPILLACVAGALILANAVISDRPEDETGNRVIAWGAMALAAVMLPLAVIAAVATGLRIDQYGFTPERLWALVCVIVACAYGLAYWVALARGRTRWADRVRPANLRLAFGVCGLALFLALPIVSFNAISVRDQVARLEHGRVKPDRFDWAALAFDFGAPGKAALARLARSPDRAIARLAQRTGKADSRWSVGEQVQAATAADTLDRRLRVLPIAAPLPPALRQRLTNYDACSAVETTHCTVVYKAGANEAFVIGDDCYDQLAKGSGNLSLGGCAPLRLRLTGAGWDTAGDGALDPKAQAAIVAAYRAGRIKVRPVTRRQLFIGDRPVGEAFE